jgi:hypothetical protein
MADGATHDPAAWTHDSFKSAADFTITLTDQDREELRAAVVAIERGERPGRIEIQTQEHFPFPKLGPKLARALDAVRSGRGFVVLRGLPTGGFTLDRFEAAVWGIGAHFGRALSQNAQGELIGHVVDATHEDPTPRMYRSAQELGPHSDITAMIALACWHTSVIGGVTVLTSGITVHDEIKRRAPELLAPLYRGFHYHRLGEEGPNETPITPHRIPVFGVVDDVLSCRYQRVGIAAGEHGLGHTLSDSELAALNLFDQVARAPENRVAFQLERGDMLVINNYTVLHARTRFTNPPEAALKRHLVRLWLDAPDFRKVPPSFCHFAVNGVPPQPGRSCTYDFKKLYQEASQLTGGMADLKLAQGEIV